MLPPPLRIVFAGTPEFAATHLQALIDSRHQICAVYTQPDRPAGRGRKITESEVKQLASDHELLVCQPKSLKTTEARKKLYSLKADILVVVAYGVILPVEFLEIPRLGSINVHASLLPRWRGAAPIQRAIEAGDKETGITIMQMDAGLDTGDMLLTSTIIIEKNETSKSLHDSLMKKGAETLIKALDSIAQGDLSPRKQDDTKACYAKKLTKAEASVDWSLSAEIIDRKIRAYMPWPGSYVSLNKQKMKVLAEPFMPVHLHEEVVKDGGWKPGEIISANEKGLRVACNRGSLLITSLQMPGKKMIAVACLLNAYQDQFLPGQQFDQ